jgi:hypothetical protein
MGAVNVRALNLAMVRDVEARESVVEIAFEQFVADRDDQNTFEHAAWTVMRERLLNQYSMLKLALRCQQATRKICTQNDA